MKCTLCKGCFEKNSNLYIVVLSPYSGQLKGSYCTVYYGGGFLWGKRRIFVIGRDQFVEWCTGISYKYLKNKMYIEMNKY